MNINKVLNAEVGIRALSNQKLPIQLSYKLNKLADKCQQDTIFYREKFNEILNEFGQKDEDGNWKFNEDGSSILIKNECLDKCEMAMNELNNLDCEGYDTYMMPITLFEDVEISPADLSTLMPFITE